MLTDQNIVDICNVLDLFRLEDQEDDQLVIQQHKIHLAQQLYGNSYTMTVQQIKKKVFHKFCDALYIPGKAYGHIAASSNSEPATQKVLKSSHSAGLEGKRGNATGELISCSKNPVDNWIQTLLNADGKDACETFINNLIVFNYQTVIQAQPDGDTFLLDGDNFKIDFSIERMVRSKHTIFDCVKYLFQSGVRVKKITYNDTVFTVAVAANSTNYQTLLSLNVKTNSGIIGTSIRDLDLVTTCLINWTNKGDYHTAQLNTFFYNLQESRVLNMLRRFKENHPEITRMQLVRDVLGEQSMVKIYGHFELNNLLTFDHPSRFVHIINLELSEKVDAASIILQNADLISLSETTCSNINTMYDLFGITSARHFAFKRWIDLVSPNGEVPQAYIELLLCYIFEQAAEPLGIVRAADKTRNPLTLGAEENILRYVTEGSVRGKEYPIDDLITQILTGTQAQSYGLHSVGTSFNTDVGTTILSDYNIADTHVSKLHVQEMRTALAEKYNLFLD